VEHSDDASAQRCRDALAAGAQAGPYFAVEPADTGQLDWRPLRELLVDATLDERVGTAQAFLQRLTGGEVERRACASIDALGVAARLVSPPLAAAVLAGVVPGLDLDRVSWRAVEGGPLPLAYELSAGRDVDSAQAAAEALVELILHPVVSPLLDRYREHFQLSPQVLQGNVVSALAGAAGMLLRAGLALRLDPVAVVQALLERGPLAGSGRYERPFTGVDRQFFVRNSCCLYYRVPGGGTCGDCVLVPEAARRQGWRAELERQP